MDTTADHPMQEYSWHAHPAGERAGAAVGASLAVLAVAGAIYASFASIAWGALALVVLVAALNRFYFPSRFTLDDQGITARYLLRTQRYRWRDIRRFVVDERGGYLSTRMKRSRMDAYRGLHVLFGANRDAVVERIRACLREDGNSCAG